MSNITANARKLLVQQQQQMRGGTNTHFEISNLFQNVYDNIPDETKRFLELSQDFIHMGSPMLANAYISKCLEYMEQAKGALVQNMSVAGSIVSFDSRADVVQPWINRNSTFMNRTGAPSQAGTMSSFKRPLPVRPALSSRKQLRPIHENLSHTSHALPAPPPPQQTFRRPAKPHHPPTSDEEVPILNPRQPSRMIRSTPIRPDIDRRPGGNYVDDNDENMFESISPLRSRKPIRPQTKATTIPTDEGEDDLLTKNSPSTRSNSKKPLPTEASAVKKKVMPPPPPLVEKAEKKKKVGRPLSKSRPTETSGDTLNSTITKHGRVVKPPKKYCSSQDNSINKVTAVAEKPSSKPEADTTVTKKRKLLPTVEDDIENSVRQPKARQQKPSSHNRETSSTLVSTSKPTTAVSKVPSSAKRAPTSQHKQTKPATSSAKTPPSPIVHIKKLPSIKKTYGGTPHIEFDVSQHSFRSCESDSESDF